MAHLFRVNPSIQKVIPAPLPPRVPNEHATVWVSNFPTNCIDGRLMSLPAGVRTGTALNLNRRRFFAEDPRCFALWRLRS